MAGVFKDATGREWSVRLTYGSVSRIRETTGVNILFSSKTGTHGYFDLITDAEKFINALWILIALEADKRSITRQDFEDSFSEDTYPAATAALYDALASFSPLPAVSKEAFGTGEEMNRLLTSTARNTAGNSPDSSGSTPPT